MKADVYTYSEVSGDNTGKIHTYVIVPAESKRPNDHLPASDSLLTVKKSTIELKAPPHQTNRAILDIAGIIRDMTTNGVACVSSVSTIRELSGSKIKI